MAFDTKAINNIIKEQLGDDVMPVVRLLRNRKSISELKMAEQMKIDINQVRSLLYKLQEANLVTFEREKEPERGWYIYHWSISHNGIDHLLTNVKKEKIEELNSKIEHESSSLFFSCPDRCLRLNFDAAMLAEYKCPECGVLMQHEDNSDSIENMAQKINQIKKGRTL